MHSAADTLCGGSIGRGTTISAWPWWAALARGWGWARHCWGKGSQHGTNPREPSPQPRVTAVGRGAARATAPFIFLGLHTALGSLPGSLWQHCKIFVKANSVLEKAPDRPWEQSQGVQVAPRPIPGRGWASQSPCAPASPGEPPGRPPAQSTASRPRRRRGDSTKHAAKSLLPSPLYYTAAGLAQRDLFQKALACLPSPKALGMAFFMSQNRGMQPLGRAHSAALLGTRPRAGLIPFLGLYCLLLCVDPEIQVH